MQPVTGSGRVVAARYELLGPVGHGAMGTVWRARDLRLDRDVAVKEVRLPGPMTAHDRSVLRERSLREARVAARLTHPGVVTVHDVIEAEGGPWIIMELVPSRSLAQVLAEDGPLSPARAAAMGMTLLEALGSAHAAGVVHRDVKPGNILVTPEGRVVLTDFGIATLQGDPGLTQAGMVMGTPGFCAPERIRGEPASPASDLWSLGATLYAAVEGRGPFQGQGSAMAVLANIVHGDPPPATRAGPLEPVILALMKRDPAARPSAAGARRLLTAACCDYGAETSGSALDGPSVSDGPGAPRDYGVFGPARTDAGETPGDALDDAEIRGEANGTLPFPASRPQDAAVFAGRAPAAALAPTVTASPVKAQPVPAQPPTRPVSAHPSPAALATGRAPAASDAALASSAPWGSGGRPRGPGRHRRALMFGGGGAAMVLAVLMIALAVSHAARLQEMRRVAASGPITPPVALPAGYHWLTEPALASPRRAGFAMAVPDGWPSRQRGDTILVRNPATGASITVTREAPGGVGPLRRAQLLADRTHRAFPGYHRIALMPVPFHGSVAGAWRFAYERPGIGNEQVLELVARLDTPLGAQPYELTLTSPRQAWLASRAAFGEAMDAFTPQP